MKYAIVIDDAFQGAKNGIGVDSEQIMRNLQSAADIYEFHIIKDAQISRFIIFRKILFIIFSRRCRQKVKHGDIFFQPQPSFRVPSKSGTKWIIRIHDIFPLTNPNWFNKPSTIYFKKALEYAISNDARFLCNSNSTKENLIERYPETNGRIDVWECEPQNLDYERCCECEGCKLVQENSIQRIILSVGTIEPRKNYQVVLKAWKSIFPLNTPKVSLLIVGKYGWRSRRLRKVLRSKSSTNKNIYWVQTCCPGALRELYQRADAYVSASFDEGFNIPLIEARSFGIPLILSDIQVHRLLHNDEASYFKNEADLVDLIRNTSNLKKTLTYSSRNSVEKLQQIFR